MADQNITQQNPFLVYGQLGAVIGAIVISVGNYRIEPNDHHYLTESEFATFYDREFKPVLEYIKSDRARWNQSNKEKNTIEGRRVNEIRRMQEDIKKLQAQVFDLYANEKD